MEPLAAGAVILVPFPFSDLSRSKLRPALVLASSGRGDFILSQITSNAYADPWAVELSDVDFAEGSLRRRTRFRAERADGETVHTAFPDRGFRPEKL